MQGYRDAARALTDILGLTQPPIAVAFVDEQPAGVATLAKRAPSACAMWRLAELQTFYASATAHAGCAVGSHVMGLSLSETTAQELAGSAQLMVESGYMAPDEIARLPRVREPYAGIVYGPLAEFPLAATATLLWVRPSQSMLLEEGLGEVRWTASEVARVFGRPGCGALAVAVNTSGATRSAGCIGMRTFTRIGDELSAFVLPGGQIEAVVQRLRAAQDANAKMLAHYETQLAQFDMAAT